MGAERSPYVVDFNARMALMAKKPLLDVRVCDHCNLRCAGCLHFAPLAEERFLDLDEYKQELSLLSSIEHIHGYFDSIVLMGGEPLLHPRIVEVIHMTRQYLPDEQMSLCTNGLVLRRMDATFWDALVECDVKLYLSPYPIKLDYKSLVESACERGVRTEINGDITGTCDGKEVFMHLALDPDGTCDPASSFTSCPFGGYFLQLSHGAIWPCQITALHGDFSRRFGYDMHDGPDDSLPLEAIVTADDIETFRRRSHPMCRYCNNDALTTVPWRRSKFRAEEWLA